MHLGTAVWRGATKRKPASQHGRQHVEFCSCPLSHSQLDGLIERVGLGLVLIKNQYSQALMVAASTSNCSEAIL
jgi:hypothetical protein